MAKIENSFFDIGYMDKLSCGDSSLHLLDPRAKLITTILFIALVVSNDKYSISSLIPFFIYPIILISAGGLPAGYILKKALIVTPFALMIGIFNPIMDREILFQIGAVNISGGWVSFFSIILRFLLTASAALILIALTGFNAVCMAMEKLGAPKPFVLQLMFLHRYMFVLIGEAARMVRAKSLRSLNSNKMSFKTFTSLLGHLLLRSLDRSQRIHLAMRCRGFDGDIRIMKKMKVGFKEIIFIVGWTSLFIIMRYYNVTVTIGNFIKKILQ